MDHIREFRKGDQVLKSGTWRRVACAAALSASCALAQTLTITPNRALSDRIVVIHASGLQPGERVTLQADLADGDGQRWQSEAEFAADAQGEIDVSAQAPISGSYREISAMGPVWSMKPTEKGVSAYRSPAKFGPQQIRFQLLRQNGVIATAQFEQDAIAEGVRQIKIEGQLHGILFVPAGRGRHPGVLVLGGSEGGLPGRRAAWLASHGYAAFALAYFRYENLPARLEAIPLEYFGQALEWMKSEPDVSSTQIGVMGVSRGGELALQLGSMYPLIKAVVAFVPANVRHRACCGGNSVPYAWTWKGMPLAFVGRDERGVNAMLAAIEVENSSGPILLIAGEQDHVWDSAGMAKQTVSRLKHQHFAYQVDTLIYPHAGHRAGRPDIVPEFAGASRHPVSGRLMDFGGTPEGNARSSIDAIPKILEFLRQNLHD
jgi:dienelactone hydrolase